MAIDPSARQALLAAKLRALVRDEWGDVADRAEPGPFPGGAALAEGSRAWVLVEDNPGRALGPAVVWALRHEAPDLCLFVPAEGPALARRAACFEVAVEIRTVVGREQSIAEPAPARREPPLDPDAEAFRPVVISAGAEPVIEHGRLLGEVRGLEVARTDTDDAGVYLSIGVGAHDRELHRLLGHNEGEVADLAAVVATVDAHRRPGHETHAAYQLAPERWLRWTVVNRPALVGAATLEPSPSPVDRPDLRRPAPAPAAGADLEGQPLLVVCSTGIDVDLVPAAADAWLSDGRRPRLVLCVPEGDDHRVTRDLAAALEPRAEVVTVPSHWRALISA